MKKIIKGKSYIFFGNFANCEEVAKQLSEQLEIEAKAFLSKTDTTAVVEYCEEDCDYKEKYNNEVELRDSITKELYYNRDKVEKLEQQIEYYKKNYKKKLF